MATAVILLAHGKDYYLAPAYPAMFAAGAVVCAGLNRWLRTLWLAGAVALSLVAAPVVLPLLSPPALDHYLRVTNLRPRPSEVESIGAPLTQIFSDELGWRKLEQQVAAVYWSLSPADGRTQRFSRRITAKPRRSMSTGGPTGYPRHSAGSSSITCGERTAMTAASSFGSMAIRIDGAGVPRQRNRLRFRGALCDAIRKRSDHRVPWSDPATARGLAHVQALSLTNRLCHLPPASRFLFPVPEMFT